MVLLDGDGCFFNHQFTIFNQEIKEKLITSLPKSNFKNIEISDENIRQIINKRFIPPNSQKLTDEQINNLISKTKEDITAINDQIIKKYEIKMNSSAGDDIEQKQKQEQEQEKIINYIKATPLALDFFITGLKTHLNKLKDCGNFILASGTNRQDMLTDFANCISHKNGMYAIGFQKLADLLELTQQQRDFSMLVDEQAPLIKSQSSKQLELSLDVVPPKPAVEESQIDTFRQMIHRYDTFDLLEPDNTNQYFFDDSKVILVLSAMQRHFNDEPKPVPIELIDDNLEILNGLKKFFEKNPWIIPKNMNLILNRYNSKVHSDVNNIATITGNDNSENNSPPFSANELLEFSRDRIPNIKLKQINDKLNINGIISAIEGLNKNLNENLNDNKITQLINDLNESLKEDTTFEQIIENKQLETSIRKLINTLSNTINATNTINTANNELKKRNLTKIKTYLTKLCELWNNSHFNDPTFLNAENLNELRAKVEKNKQNEEQQSGEELIGLTKTLKDQMGEMKKQINGHINEKGVENNSEDSISLKSIEKSLHEINKFSEGLVHQNQLSPPTATPNLQAPIQNMSQNITQLAKSSNPNCRKLAAGIGLIFAGICTTLTSIAAIVLSLPTFGLTAKIAAAGIVAGIAMIGAGATLTHDYKKKLKDLKSSQFDNSIPIKPGN